MTEDGMRVSKIDVDWNDDWNGDLASHLLCEPPSGFADRARTRFVVAVRRRNLIAALITGLLLLLLGGVSIWMAVIYIRLIASIWAGGMEGLGAFAGVLVQLWQLGPQVGLVLAAAMWAMLFGCAGLLARIFRDAPGC